jgi:hypothetical protein
VGPHELDELAHAKGARKERFLGRDPDGTPRGGPGRVGSEQPSGAGVWTAEAEENAERRRLPGAVRRAVNMRTTPSGDLHAHQELGGTSPSRIPSSPKNLSASLARISSCFSSGRFTR